MNKHLVHCAGAVALLLVLIGCAATPMREPATALLPWRKIAPELVQQRTNQLKNVLANCPVRGIGFQLAAYPEDLYPVEDLTAKIADYGFNRVYLYLSSETELNSHLRRFVTSCAERKIAVELQIRQRDYFHRRLTGGLLRHAWGQTPDLTEVVAQILSFNASLPEVEADPRHGQLAGVTIMAEPHCFDGLRPSQQPIDLPYFWNPDVWGANSENDMLMAHTLQLFRALAAQLQGQLPLTVMIPDYYQEWVAAKKLSCGSVADWSQISGKLLIQSSGHKPSELYKNTKLAVGALPSGSRAILAVPLAEHVSVSSGALRRRNWNDLVHAVNYVLKQYRKAPVAGIVLSPLPEIDFLRLQED